MMQRGRFSLTILLSLLAATNQAAAQSSAYQPPNLKTVLFAGYSSVSIKPGKDLDRQSLNGWTLSIADYHAFQRWGLTAEFGGASKEGTTERTYLFGGTYRSFQRRRFALTGRILAGATTWDPKAPIATRTENRQRSRSALGRPST